MFSSSLSAADFLIFKTAKWTMADMMVVAILSLLVSHKLQYRYGT